MSHKRKKDYEAVFSKLIELVNFPQVEEIVSDFEAAVWVTLKKLLPEVKIKGCGFHLNQAMFKNIKKIGLGPQYIRDKQCRQMCRQIMLLNLLPKKNCKTLPRDCRRGQQDGKQRQVERFLQLR